MWNLRIDRRRMYRAARWVGLMSLVVSFGLAPTALAEPNDDGATKPKKRDTQPPRQRARAAFLKGTRLVREAMWGEALAQFELAQDLFPHAITLYNIGICERASGRYTAARTSLKQALATHETGDTILPKGLLADARGYLRQIDRTVARVRLKVKPTTARLSIDGRPLSTTKRKRDGAPIMVAGIHAPGPAEPLTASTIEIEIDPGRHVLTFSQRGFADAVVRKDFTSGDNPDMELALDRLPATIRVKGGVPGAIATLDGKDMGPLPLTLRRPAGSYDLLVQADGYEDYASRFTVRPGEETSLTAKLPVDEPLIVEQWWFWTAATAVLAGAAVGTYFLVRDTPEPERQSVSGGSLGWSIEIP